MIDAFLIVPYSSMIGSGHIPQSAGHVLLPVLDSILVLITSIFNHPEIFVSNTQKFVQLINGVHCGWNGQFFMSRTVDARTRFDLARKAAKTTNGNGAPRANGFAKEKDGEGNALV